MTLSRRAILRILAGSAALAAAPAPLRKYFIIGRPERRFAPLVGGYQVITWTVSLQAAVAHADAIAAEIRGLHEWARGESWPAVRNVRRMAIV